MSTPPDAMSLFWVSHDRVLCAGLYPVAALFGPVEYAQLRQVMNQGPSISSETFMMTGKVTFGGLPVRRMRAPGVAIVTGKWKPKV